MQTKIKIILGIALTTIIGVLAGVFAMMMSNPAEDASTGLYTILFIAAILLSIVAIAAVAFFVTKKIIFYENLLDSIEFPITVTDMNRRWTFINKAVEDMLGKTRDQIRGHQCSEWGAAICGTDNCGINCLEKGNKSTEFEQFDMTFRVYVSYMTDRNSKKLGHIEFVQNISDLVESQIAEAGLVAEIEKIIDSFVTSANQISDGSQSLAQGTTEQAASIQELSSSISEVSEKTKSNANMASKAAGLTDTIRNNAQKGSRQMKDMITAVDEINEASGKISKVIKVIDDIAFQTNILALNAAVEAARAGQHGKGFAVVAEEVRNLAAKSAEAAKDTSSLIENSIEKANLGVSIAGETSTSLVDIVNGVNESNELVSVIAKSSEEQSVAISQINIGIDQVAQVVQQNSATAQQSAATSTEMSSKAKLLKEMIDAFEDKYHVSEIAAHHPQKQLGVGSSE
ncbi:MAG: methyl-accepting chemotaxis protein [Oscillospiraceae bacterium]|jgi:methyl-accepting chemotaxis protein|nr:methyl-accepting chemotaxis protein [Oscillospiraceae bacterium]